MLLAVLFVRNTLSAEYPSGARLYFSRTRSALNTSNNSNIVLPMTSCDHLAHVHAWAKRCLKVLGLPILQISQHQVVDGLRQLPFSNDVDVLHLYFMSK